MADKKWTHLKLKNGDKVQFVPPAPDGEHLGGVTQEEKESIAQLNGNVEKHTYQIDNLNSAANGRLYHIETNESISDRKVVPANALPWATLDKISATYVFEANPDTGERNEFNCSPTRIISAGHEYDLMPIINKYFNGKMDGKNAAARDSIEVEDGKAWAIQYYTKDGHMLIEPERTEITEGFPFEIQVIPGGRITIENDSGTAQAMPWTVSYRVANDTVSAEEIAELKGDIVKQVNVSGVALEKVDGVVNIPVSTGDNVGLVYANGYGVRTTSSGGIRIVSASNNTVDAKTDEYSPITPNKIDRAVRSGLISNSQITAADYANIQQTIGIRKMTQEEYNLITPDDNTIYLIVG